MPWKEPGMAHVSEEQLERYSMHKLSEDELAPIEEHLPICELCQQHLIEVDESVLILKSAARQIVKGRKPLTLTRAIAKAVLVVEDDKSEVLLPRLRSVLFRIAHIWTIYASSNLVLLPGLPLKAEGATGSAPISTNSRFTAV
jgi:hypothetical protein